MSDEAQHDAATAEATGRRGEIKVTKRRRRWPWIVVGVLVVLPALLLTAWTIISLSFSYSTGDRAGYIQKLSKKGWICKTWEG